MEKLRQLFPNWHFIHEFRSGIGIGSMITPPKRTHNHYYLGVICIENQYHIILGDWHDPIILASFSTPEEVITYYEMVYNV